jgi:hypothetical protein
MTKQDELVMTAYAFGMERVPGRVCLVDPGSGRGQFKHGS